MAKLPANMNIINRVFEKASEQINKDYSEILQIFNNKNVYEKFIKNSYEFISGSMLSVLAAATPRYGIVCDGVVQKESTDDNNSRWIVKVLDGFDNFKKGLPQFCCAIAFEQKNEIVTTCIYDPITNEQFWAQKGYGAFVSQTLIRNSTTRLRVSDKYDLQESCFSTKISYNLPPNFIELTSKVGSLRVSNCSLLEFAYFSAGRIDGIYVDDIDYYNLTSFVNLLVIEAGGFIGDFNKNNELKELKNIVSSNETLYNKFFKDVIN